MDKEYIYLGYAIEKTWVEKFPVASPAGNNFQLGFIEAWKKRNDMQVYSILPIATWPNDHRLIISGKMEELSESDIKIIPFVNIKIIKELSTIISVARILKGICETNNGKELNIITYNGNGPLSLPVLWLRKKYKYTYICMVVDPPLYKGTTNRKGKIWSFLYKKLADSFMKAAKECDRCIVLNSYFAREYLQRNDYYVLDCGVTPDLETQHQEVTDIVEYWKKDGNIHMVFTGMLHEHSGIFRFAQMLQKIQMPGVILHIFGRGIYEEQIKQIAEESPNIFYHGYIENEYVRKVQQRADILVCPNTIEHPINKVAFPSKIQEYMLSKVPVLATRVNGLGKEYYPYIYSYDDSLEDLKKTICKMVNDGESVRKNKALEAQKFILREKTWDVQIQKLMSYLEKE